MQNQPDAIATIQQAAQIASSINTTAVQTPGKSHIFSKPNNLKTCLATNPIAAAANLNNLSQIAAMQAPADTIVSIQQAAQIAQSVQSPSKFSEALFHNYRRFSHDRLNCRRRQLSSSGCTNATADQC